jgi:hypothetical protein
MGWTWNWAWWNNTETAPADNETEQWDAAETEQDGQEDDE